MREYEQKTREDYEKQEKGRGKIVHALFIIFMVVLGVYLFRDQIPTIGDLSFRTFVEEKIGIGHTTVNPKIEFRTADALSYSVTPQIRIQYKLDGIHDEETLRSRVEQQVTYKARDIIKEFGINRSLDGISGIYSIKKDVCDELSKLFADTTNGYVVENIIVDNIEFSKHLLDLIHKQREALAQLRLEEQKIIAAGEELKRANMIKAGLTPEQVRNIEINTLMAKELAKVKMPKMYVADTKISEELMEDAIKAREKVRVDKQIEDSIKKHK